MANYGILIQVDNQPVYIRFGYWSTDVTDYSTIYLGDLLTRPNTGGTDLRTLYNEPLIDTPGENTEYIYPILNTENRYLYLRVNHARGYYDYTLSIGVLRAPTYSYSNLIGELMQLNLDCADDTDNNDYKIYQMPRLLCYPELVDSDDITHFGVIGYWGTNPNLSTTKRVGHIFKLPSSSFGNWTFTELFGMSSRVPTYPDGGVDPVDDLGGNEYNFDTDSDDIEMPSVVASAINNGYIQTYVITASQMAELMSEVLDFTNTTVTDFWSNVSKVFGDPISAIISLKQFCLPTEDIPTWGATNVKLLNFTSEVNCPVVNVQYAIIDIGSIDVKEFFGSFLDYPPYTRCTIYLPFIGEKELNVQEVMDATLHLYYMVDYLTGNCVAHLIVTKTAGETNLNSDLYQWQGNLATDIPISGNNDANTLGNMLTSAISGLTAGMSRSIGGEISSIENELSSASGSKVLAGSIGGGYSLMGVRVPYIKIENPIQTMPENFQELRGLAGNINHTIGDLSGFLRCREVDINNITATDDEKAELYALLTGGIFV